MTSIVGDLAVRVGADTEGLTRGLNTASKKLGDFGKKSRTAATDIAKIGTAAAAAGAALAVTLVNSSAAAAKEIQNLATISGTSASRFQALATASKTVGIEQDKLADIFKDMNDRVGDFVATGAGPMADFFENIAPKVGVTADEFQRLSGPKALQLYVDSLEKANIGQAQMTFYMEALASDSTALLPLLRDNGKALEEQAQRVQELGIALSDIDTKNLAELSNDIDGMKDIFSSLGSQFTAQFAPALRQVSKDFEQMVINAGGVDDVAVEAFNNVVGAASFVANSIEGLKRTFEIAGKSIAMLGLGAQEVGLMMVEWVVNRPVQAFNELIAAYNKIPFLSDAPEVSLTQFGQGLVDQIDLIRNAITEAELDIQETIMKPITSGDQFQQYVIKAKEANQAVTDANAVQKQLQLEGETAFQQTINEIVTEANDWRYQHEAEQAQKRIDLAQAEADAKKKALGKGLSDLSTLMNSESRKMFEVGKAAAIANTTISTIQSAQDAYKALAGIPVVGPALGTAAAAAAIAAGTARVQAINSTSFKGGGSPNRGSNTQSVNDAGTPVSGQGGQVQQFTDVRGLTPGEFIPSEMVIGLINDAVENGSVLRVAQ